MTYTKQQWASALLNGLGNSNPDPAVLEPPAWGTGQPGQNTIQAPAPSTTPASGGDCPAAIQAIGLCSAWSAWVAINTPTFWSRIGIGLAGVVLIGAGAWSAIKQVQG